MSASTAPRPDVESIVPQPGYLDVEGIPCQVNRIRTLELISLFGILSAGIGRDGLAGMHWNDSEQLQGDMVAVLLLSLPDASQEFVAFLRTVIVPVDPARRDEVAALLTNPDPEVMLNAVEIIALQERDDLASLMGKARAMLARLQGHKAPASPNPKTPRRRGTG